MSLAAQPNLMIEESYIQELRLQNFRNYDHLTLSVDHRPVILTGDNGAGKTNVLEALSLLSPGRGLRKAKLKEFHRFDCSDTIWTVLMHLCAAGEQPKIGTGSDPINIERRVVKIDGEFKPQTALQSWVDVVWQTPQMDRLFIDGKSVRRQFLDKMVGHADAGHRKRIYRFEYAMRERLKLLKDRSGDALWLEELEHTMARESVAIVAGRLSFLQDLNRHCALGVSSFPKAYSKLVGEVEGLLENKPALQAEEELQKIFSDSRSMDQRSGMTRIGAHQSNLCVYNLDFDRPAEVSSTGEQKALLLSLIMAQSRLLVHLKGVAPIVLLDEVVAHLDQRRRCDLFDEIASLKMQAWMTGTDARSFEDFGSRAQFLDVIAGNVIQMA